MVAAATVNPQVQPPSRPMLPTGGEGMAFAILFVGIVIYAVVFASMQRARSKAGEDIATPPWWERRPNKGSRDL